MTDQRQVRPGLPEAAFLAATGLSIQAAAYELARKQHTAPAEILFFFGLVLEFAPCARILTRLGITRTSRMIAGLLVGFSFYISEWLAQPHILARYDELLHLTSLWQLTDGRHLFASNTMIPISPYYPGLELFTAGLHWTTGLPGLPSQTLVILGARTLLLVSLFLIVERIAHSDRTAGFAIALYVANPQFYIFDAQYAYETLALSLALTALYCALRAADDPDSPTRNIIQSTIALALLAITHHVTSWATLVAIAGAAVWLTVTERRSAAHVFRILAIVDIAVVGGWSLFVGQRIGTYLGPLTRQAADSFLSVILRRQSGTTLFAQPTGAKPATWEQALILASVIGWILLLLSATLSSRGRRLLRDTPMLWLLVAGSATYPMILVLHVSALSAEYGNRAAALVFLFVASWLAIWLADLVVLRRPWYRVTALAVLITLMVGGVLFGAGPDYNRLPGPYLVEADQRSIDHNALAAARWAQARLPQQTRIAADRDNSALMAAVGHLAPVTQASGSENVGSLYFANSIGPEQDQLVRQGRVRLLLVDRRLSTSLPYVGVYFEAGETGTLRRKTDQRSSPILSAGNLSKFAHWPEAVAIYRGGPITIYDVSSVSGLPPVIIGLGAAQAGDLAQTDWLKLMSLSLVLLLSLLFTRRRSPLRNADVLASLADGLALTVILFVCAALIVVETSLPPIYVSVGTVALIVGGPLRRGRPNVLRIVRPGTVAMILTGLAGLLTVGSIAISLAAAPS